MGDKNDVAKDDPTRAKSLTSSGSFDTVGMTSDELKREFDMFRDVLNNVNNTLRFQIQMSVPLLAACVTVLNLVPPAEHLKLLNDLDRWVFLPALLSMAIGYHGLEQHFYSNKSNTRLDSDVKELYKIVRYKYRCVRWGLILQGIGVVLMMVFVMLEYK